MIYRHFLQIPLDIANIEKTSAAGSSLLHFGKLPTDMSPKNGSGSTRKSNRNKTKKKDSQIAVSDARTTSLTASQCSTPSRSSELPLRNPNKSPTETVSSSPSSSDNPNYINSALNQDSITGVTDDTLGSPLHVFESKLSLSTLAAAAEVSDNRAILSPMATPPQLESTPTTSASIVPEDIFQSAPTDPWHLTFNELRAMRARMSTLDRLEKVTEDLALQLQGITSKTNNMETNISKNNAQIKTLGKDVSGLRKDIDKQYKDSQLMSKEIKDFKKDVAQVKEVGKGISGLRKNIQEQHKNCQHNSKILCEIKEELTQVGTVRKEFTTLKADVSTQQEAQQLTSNVVKEIQEEIKSLRQTVDQQQETIKDLHKIKDDFKKNSHKSVGDMNKLLEAQKAQVEQFRNIRTQVQQESQQQKQLLEDFRATSEDRQKDTQQQIQHISEDIVYKELKDKAFNNRHNLVIIGLPEQDTNNSVSVATKFFSKELKIRKRLEVTTAYRIGQVPPEGNPYIRPLIVKFAKLPDRNLIWRHRRSIPQEEGKQIIRIQADLPKQLRDDISLLYKVARAASTMEDYKSAKVRDYALSFNGKLFSAKQLEQLPPPLRPSSLAVRKSDDTLVFFSKSCILSNHFPSPFRLKDRVFSNMEHYLAFERARLSEQKHLIEKAIQAEDPLEAKSLLNFLRTDHPQEWQERRADIAITGLREKFRQNKHLADFLLSTKNQTLGEASKNPNWGVGMTLDDQHVLDSSKWIESGNLLGTLLMQLRTELQHSPKESSQTENVNS